MAIDKILEECGFSEREQKVLGYLAQYNSGSASLIAKRTGLKRPTVYAILDTLIEQGFVNKKQQGKVTTFTVIAKEEIPILIRNRARNQYRSVENATELLEEELRALPNLPVNLVGGFQIETLENAEVVYLQLNKALVEGHFSAIFNPQIACVGPGKPIIAQFLAQTGETKPPIREIIVRGPMAEWYKKQVRNPNHQIKELAPERKILSDMIFADGAVILSHYGQLGEESIKITHHHFYLTMLSVFEELWRSLEIAD